MDIEDELQAREVTHRYTGQTIAFANSRVQDKAQPCHGICTCVYLKQEQMRRRSLLQHKESRMDSNYEMADDV